jgi:hypothetical protein
MKKIAILFTLVFVNISILLAQAPPQGINYQAVVYSDHGNNQPGLNVPGQVLRNKNIKVRFTIIQNATSGSEIYKETHSTTTDAFGMFSLVIGQGTQVGSIAFSGINWGAGKHFLKVEIDKNAGSNFVTMSNQQLLSVPYALYADKSTYSTTSGNGIVSVSDNGNGTLTFTYFDGSTYTTPVLTGLQGPQGIQGPAGQNGTNGVNGTNGANGQNGLSAYEIWLSQGNTGTEQDFLAALIGAQGAQGIQGVTGQNGLSAYEVWLSQGNTGTQQDYLTAITGPQGVQGIQGSTGAGLNILNTFNIITELPLSGNPGDAYLVGGDLYVWSQNTNTWNNAGNVQGPQGLTGQNGLSAYEVWLSQGNTGTVQDYITAITGAQGSQGVQGASGQNGTNGQSAYEVWLSQGNIGTVQDYLTSITGSQGSQGIQGVAGQNGNDGKNTLVKTSTETAGTNCASGGVKIEYGLDSNNNGSLEVSEINLSLTKYICNGIDGAIGAQGPQGIGGFVHHIGEEFGGGVIFHLWKDGNGIEHGLIVSTQNQSSGFVWSNMNTTLVGINAQSSWDGLNNSLAIVSQNGHSSSSAQICIDLVSNGYSDWYLPAIDELSLLWHNRFNVNKTLSSIPNADIFSMANTFYWSSTETTFSDVAWYFAFDSGSANANLGYFKNATHRVRAIRAF